MKKTFDLVTELNCTMEVFMELGTFTEVRILKTNQGTVSGYYDDMEKLIKDIQPYDGKNNVFFTMNQLVDNVEKRSLNRLMKGARQTTSDAEIKSRRWVLIDLDPERKSGISSTEDELNKALELSNTIEEFLCDNGFSQPVKAISGNGYHLLYPVDLPNTKKSTALVKKFLRALHEKFSTEAVKVDITTYNAARITKLYGTVACKGENTEERPHRRSRILTVPPELIPVEAALLEKISSYTKEKPDIKKTVGERAKEEKQFSLENWLKKHKIAVAKIKDVEKGKCYVLTECPWTKEHSVDNGSYIIQFDDGNIFASCHHTTCQDNGENWKSLWKRYEGDNPIPKTVKPMPEEKKSQVDILLQIAEEERHRLFRNKAGDTFVQVPKGDSMVCYSIMSEPYSRCLICLYLQRFRRSPQRSSIQQALETQNALAEMSGEVYDVHKRFAMYDDCLYYNLADDDNTVLAVSKDGIRICPNPPVRLIKRKSQLPQPMPLEGKDFLELMGKYYHFSSEADRVLHDTILIVRLISHIEQPLVIYTGEKGSSKTTSMDMDKQCLDYSSNNVTVMPSNMEDFLLLLSSQDIVCLDNVDYISKSMSDVFCQAVTGATAVKRKKYENYELCEVFIKSTIYLNGINLLSKRSDFLDRSIFLNMKVISKEDRKSKTEVMEEFVKDKPYILYGIFKTLSEAIKLQKEVKISVDDRLMDFLRWGYAVAEVLGYGGENFLTAYKQNRGKINEELLANDEVAHAVLCYLEEYQKFTGNMTDLSLILTEILNERGILVSNRIKTAIQLSRRLKELITVFESIGIEVNIGRENGNRFVTIRYKSK